MKNLGKFLGNFIDWTAQCYLFVAVVALLVMGMEHALQYSEKMPLYIATGVLIPSLILAAVSTYSDNKADKLKAQELKQREIAEEEQRRILREEYEEYLATLTPEEREEKRANEFKVRQDLEAVQLDFASRMRKKVAALENRCSDYEAVLQDEIKDHEKTKAALRRVFKETGYVDINKEEK